MPALIQFVALVSGWDVRAASASVAAKKGLPKATDGSVKSVTDFVARHASDGREACVMNVLLEATTQIHNRLRRQLMRLISTEWTEDSESYSRLMLEKIHTVHNKPVCRMSPVIYVPLSVSPLPPGLQQSIVSV